jgi:single-strand selective monofunctional uracil DNA glycosylase
VNLVQIIRSLRRDIDRLSFGAPVAYVYNPLEYARAPAELYLERFGSKRGRVVLLGMNPGPFGMAQTGVPFGDIGFVRDWMGIHAKVERPASEHPKRPVEGFDCLRSEVSGSRLWGWAKERFGTPEAFFERFFVLNYCPLAFLEDSGRNRTPDRLPAGERQALFAACDRALLAAVEALRPRMVIGVGGFAHKQARDVLAGTGVPCGMMLHPSPASPKANRGWAAAAEQDLTGLGIRLGAPLESAPGTST